MLTSEKELGITFQHDMKFDIQSNFGRSNSPVSNTRDRSNSFVGPGNFPIHLMLKYAQARTAMARTLKLKAWSAGRFFM